MSIVSGPLPVDRVARVESAAAAAPAVDASEPVVSEPEPPAVIKTISAAGEAAAEIATIAGWTDGKILDAAANVASNAASTRTTIPDGSGRVIATGTRDGVDISVVLDSTGRIETSYPANPSRQTSA